MEVELKEEDEMSVVPFVDPSTALFKLATSLDVKPLRSGIILVSFGPGENGKGNDNQLRLNACMLAPTPPQT